MSWIKQIEHWATERADKIAVVCGKEKISYKMLIDKTTCLGKVSLFIESSFSADSHTHHYECKQNCRKKA